MKRRSLLRWLAVLPLVVGPVVAPLERTPETIGLSILSVGALSLLLTRLDFDWSKTLWAWVVTLVFIQGYFVPTYVAMSLVGSPEFTERFGPECVWVNPRTIVEGVRWITISFVIFCIIAWLALGRMVNAAQPPPSDMGRNRLVFRVAVVAFIVCVLAGALQVYLGVGAMGRVGTSLPFYLDTIIINTRMRIGPMLLLLAAWLHDRPTTKRQLIVVVAMTAALGVEDAFVRTSRGSLPFHMLPIFCLWAMSRRFSRGRLVAVLGVVLATVLLHPLVSTMRMERITRNEGVMDALTAAVLETGPTILESSPVSAGRVANRVNGTDGIWFSEAAVPDGLSMNRLAEFITSDARFGDYYTHTVYGLDVEADYRAPGFVGSFMILGGYGGVAIFTAIYVGLIWWGWMLVSRLRTAPVAKASMVTSLVYLVSENPLYIQFVIGTVMLVAGLEVVYRSMFVAESPASRRAPSRVKSDNDEAWRSE